MKKSRSPLLVLALTAATIFAAWKLGGALLSSSSSARKTDLLVNRVWIDHLPTGSRDMISHLVLVDHEQGKFGATGQSSQWRHLVDVFMWRLEGKELRAFFPQDQVRARARVKTWRCAGEAPQPFELCLRISDMEYKESIVLYSREDWVIDADDTTGSAAALASREPGLEGVLRALSSAAPGPAEDLDDSEHWAPTTLGDF